MYNKRWPPFFFFFFFAQRNLPTHYLQRETEEFEMGLREVNSVP